MMGFFGLIVDCFSRLKSIYMRYIYVIVKGWCKIILDFMDAR